MISQSNRVGSRLLCPVLSFVLVLAVLAPIDPSKNEDNETGAVPVLYQKSTEVNPGSRTDSGPNVYAPPQKGEVETTLMVYMCGDNDLESELIWQINQMEKAAYEVIQEYGDWFYDNTNIVVMLDRWDGYKNGVYFSDDDDTTNDDWTDTRLIHIQPDDSWDSVIRSPTYWPYGSLGELNMGDPHNLYYLIQWSSYFFPAKRYFLSISNHGGGHRGICQDYGPQGLSEDWLSIPEFGEGMSMIDAYLSSSIAGPRRVEVTALDLCSASQAEIVYEIMHYTDYLVASESIVPAEGYPYMRPVPEVYPFKGIAYWLYSHYYTDGYNFAIRIVDEYADYYYGLGIPGLAIADIDTAVFNSVLSPNLDTFATELLSALGTHRDAIGMMKEDAMSFEYGYEIDLYDLAWLIYDDEDLGFPLQLKAAALEVITAVVQSTVDGWNSFTYPERVRGIAIVFYHTPESYGNLYDSTYSVLLMSEGIEWRHFVHLYWAMEIPEKVENLRITQSDIDVYLEWDPLDDALSYEVAMSNDRFSDFPVAWTRVVVLSPSTSWVHVGGGSLSSYYVVRAYLAPGLASAPSEMAFNWWLEFDYVPGHSNIYWISLPYDTELATASDIANDLTEAKIVLVAKFDRALQQVLSYYYTDRWRGVDFSIEPGDGIYLSVVADFSWKHFGTDFTVGLQFPCSPHKQWFSLPYTHSYETASAIAQDLTVSKVKEIGKWDPATQQVGWVYYWDDVAQNWAGDDFDVSASGEGLYVIAGSLPRVSYYDTTNSALKYAEWRGPNTETVDASYDTGVHNSIVLDDSNRPHISYHNDWDGDLMYAKLTDTGWHVEPVDTVGEVGGYTSLALDASGYPHISYRGESQLKYAKLTGTGWHVEPVDTVGDVGRHTSIALDASGYPHISYYDQSFGDLKYAKLTDTGWYIESVDTDGDVGEYTSLALDSSGFPHMSYYDRTNKDLKYAVSTGAWTTETVYRHGDVGQYTSLALDSNDYPHISFFDDENLKLKYTRQTGTGWQTESVDWMRMFGAYTSIAIDSDDHPHITYVGFSWNLMYARWAERWHYVEIAGDVGLFGTHNSLALDASDHPHISFYEDIGNDWTGDLKYAKWTGGWGVETVDGTTLVGEYTSLALDASGYPHISYFDDTTNDLKYAKLTWAGWHVEPVDTSGDVGQYTSIALDASGYPHISYFDDTTNDLKYAKLTWAGWHVEPVDTSGDVGQYTSIALDASGYPHISYYDEFSGDLKYAKLTDIGWHVEPVDTSGDVGQYTSIALDASGYPHISYCDVTNGYLKYAKWTGSWEIQEVDTTYWVGMYTSLALDSNGYPHISYYQAHTSKLKYAKWTGSGWHAETVDPHWAGQDTSIVLDSADNPHIGYYELASNDLKYAKWTGSGWYIETADSGDDVGRYASIDLDERAFVWNPNLHSP